MFGVILLCYFLGLLASVSVVYHIRVNERKPFGNSWKAVYSIVGSSRDGPISVYTFHYDRLDRVASIVP